MDDYALFSASAEESKKLAEGGHRENVPVSDIFESAEYQAVHGYHFIDEMVTLKGD